jgi:hypothetical protein
MSTANISNYMNDHLAGATGALDLIRHLSAIADLPADQQFYDHLVQEIEEDKRLLSEMLELLNEKPSRVKQALGWFAEKVSRLKLELNGMSHELGHFEALELLTLGIQGKRVLWKALGVVAVKYAPWDVYDFTALEQRALEQRNRVEAKRLELAPLVLKPDV